MAKTNLSSIRDAMSLAGLRPRKMYGQNFLKERGILELIVRAGGVKPGEVVMEIGSGPGCLTEELLRAGAKVLAVEVDTGLLGVARSLLGSPEGVRWECADILESKNRLNPHILDRLEESMSSAGVGDFKLIANLPYNVAVPAIMGVLEARLPCRVMVVTVQDELAERFLADPGESGYGMVSALVSVMAEVRRIRRIGASAFWPKPKVDSSVIEIVPVRGPSFDEVLGGIPYEEFKRTARAVFAHRRKVWHRSLVKALGLENNQGLVEIFRGLAIDMDLRAERLPAAEIAKIAAALRGWKNHDPSRGEKPKK